MSDTAFKPLPRLDPPLPEKPSQTRLWATEQRPKKGCSKYCSTRYVFDPRSSTFLIYWQFLVVLTLLYTATVTPFQVSFVEDGG
eukprot:CAMPEP_0118945744 /NCGR_PEP_ID=MMETSP1169-20130426/42872_1 /TAXON_ID=36882 /ORGANISM="Pyramimonas obovata, Strain CCMP722" /LENGTH=83 /DNA_ID=CAMNT_0006891529 /DNA_START=449 /DNA_END=696 /DNA_ORIENTATION=+